MARIAERQSGVVSRAQLERCDLSGAGIARWVADRRLHRLHPGVYAIGHRALSTEARLIAAILYAGPGAMLSHLTAAWRWGLLREEPSRIHVSAPGRRQSIPGICLHHPRRLENARCGGIPVTTVARTLLDIARLVPFDRLRRALAEAEYRGLLDAEAVEGVLGRGHSGSATVRAALENHCPPLARTLSRLEERFIFFCEASGIPLPEVNVKVCGLTVDALWRRQHLVVELYGHTAHNSPAAIERDRSREMTLRAAGHVVLRYTWRQVTQHPERVAADLRSALALPSR